MPSLKRVVMGRCEMAYYRTCSYCGAALDPGERCECRAEKERSREETEELLEREETGQMVFRLGDKEERRRA